MPFAALAVALLALSGPLDPAAAAGASKPALAHLAAGSLTLALDDEIRGFRDDDDDEEASPDDHDYSYGDDDDDDEGDSAHGPDDDDGWDIDDYERSERA